MKELSDGDELVSPIVMIKLLDVFCLFLRDGVLSPKYVGILILHVFLDLYSLLQQVLPSQLPLRTSVCLCVCVGVSWAHPGTP